MEEEGARAFGVRGDLGNLLCSQYLSVMPKTTLPAFLEEGSTRMGPMGPVVCVKTARERGKRKETGPSRSPRLWEKLTDGTMMMASYASVIVKECL